MVRLFSTWSKTSAITVSSVDHTFEFLKGVERRQLSKGTSES